MRQAFAEGFIVKFNKNEAAVDYFIDHYSGKKLSSLPDEKQKVYLTELFALQIKVWTLATDKQKSYFKKTLKSYHDELQLIAEKSN